MGATGGGGYGTGEYRGLKVPPVAAWHQHVATFFGCTMWLWIFWRAKHDGAVVFFGEHPFAHGHGHGGHGAEPRVFDPEKDSFEKPGIGEAPTVVRG